MHLELRPLRLLVLVLILPVGLALLCISDEEKDFMFFKVKS